MKAITRFSKTNELKENFKISWNVEEIKNVYSYRMTKFISLYINDEKILTTKPLSIKTIAEINNSELFRNVLYILCRERKFRKEHKKIIDLIKNIIKY